MPLGVEVGIERRLDRARRVGLDMRLGGKTIVDQRAQVPRIVGGIGDDVVHARQPFDEARRLRAIAPVPGCRHQPDRQAERVDAGVDLRRQPAARAPDPLSENPPLAPVASAWALQMVLSMRTYSKSGSLANLLKRRSRAPDIAHLRNRACTAVHFPNSSGRSRHGEAVRASHSTASTNSRLSAPLRPGRPTRPGRCSSIRAHCASVRVRLLKTASVLDLESDLTPLGNPPNADSS